MMEIELLKIIDNLLYQEIPATLVFEISDDGSYRCTKREHYKGQEDTLKKRLQTNYVANDLHVVVTSTNEFSLSTILHF